MLLHQDRNKYSSGAFNSQMLTLQEMLSSWPMTSE